MAAVALAAMSFMLATGPVPARLASGELVVSSSDRRCGDSTWPDAGSIREIEGKTVRLGYAAPDGQSLTNPTLMSERGTPGVPSVILSTPVSDRVAVVVRNLADKISIKPAGYENDQGCPKITIYLYNGDSKTQESRMGNGISWK